MGEKNNITKFIYQEIVTIKAKTKVKKKKQQKTACKQHLNKGNFVYYTNFLCILKKPRDWK